jgi:hypothetical protein
MSSLKQNNDLARSASMAALFFPFVNDDDDGAMVNVYAILGYAFLFISSSGLRSTFSLILKYEMSFSIYSFFMFAWCSRLVQIVSAMAGRSRGEGEASFRRAPGVQRRDFITENMKLEPSIIFIVFVRLPWQKLD